MNLQSERRIVYQMGRTSEEDTIVESERRFSDSFTYRPVQTMWKGNPMNTYWLLRISVEILVELLEIVPAKRLESWKNRLQITKCNPWNMLPVSTVNMRLTIWLKLNYPIRNWPTSRPGIEPVGHQIEWPVFGLISLDKGQDGDWVVNFHDWHLDSSFPYTDASVLASANTAALRMVKDVFPKDWGCKLKSKIWGWMAWAISTRNMIDRL